MGSTNTHNINVSRPARTHLLLTFVMSPTQVWCGGGGVLFISFFLVISTSKPGLSPFNVPGNISVVCCWLCCEYLQHVCEYDEDVFFI